MNLDRKHIKNIISANNDNSLAIFIGAGISKSSETKSFELPTWSDLITDFKKELDDSDESDYLKIAQLYYLAFGEYTYYKKIKQYFPDYIKPSAIHNLIFEINPHIIITTNWDNILERTIEDNAYIFDTICSDTDLVKSSLQNKLVKMHGDFKNHNIVFKEDDYINYRYNFPLIENYVKSILSTHTVLFLGYSYNDINLKQIFKWIENHSDVRPPMYLATFSHNQTQNKYLENHGIITLILDNTADSIAEFDEYSNRMHAFLNRIKKQDETYIIKSKEETIDFVLGKLKNLDDLDGILIEQIQKALSNCGFIFTEDSKPILQFYAKILTGDFDKSKRNIYQGFVEILKDIGINAGTKLNPNLLKIFKILHKARIKGIIVSPEDLTKYSVEYLPIENYLKEEAKDITDIYFNFNFKDLIKTTIEVSGLFELSFKFYNLEKIEESFGLLEEAISICLKQRNYTLLFIAMFNRNILLRKLKYGVGVNRERYSNIDEYNLKGRFFNLPKDLQIALEPIYNFIDISFIYKYAYNVAEDLKKTEESKRTVESGGLVINSDIHKFSSKHENLVLFVLRNRIMIENFSEYRSINKHFIQIAITRQSQNDIVRLNRIELFACIKYIDNSEIRELFGDFYKQESKKKLEFQIANDDQNWLVNNVFENIASQLLNSHIPAGRFGRYIENTLFILSLSRLQKDKIEKVLSVIDRIISIGNNTIKIFQSINLFLGFQYKLYKLEIDERVLVELIEKLINKVVYKKLSRHEYIALASNELSNLYGYAKERKTILNNEDLIEKLLNEINSYSIPDKIEISQNLLLNLYDISNDAMKEKIKIFILGIESAKEDELYKRIIFELTLIIYEFKPLGDSIVTLLNEYLEQFKDGKQFSSTLYMLDSQVDYLIRNKEITILNDASNLIKSSIERFADSAKISIF